MDQDGLDKVAGIGAIAGIVLLFAANAIVGSTPTAADPASKVARFLADGRTKVLTSAILFAIGYVALLTFSVGLRGWLRRGGDASALPTLVFGAGVWTITVGSFAVMAVASAAYLAPALDPGTARTSFEMSNVGFAFIGAPFVALLGAASFSSLKTRALPAWIGWVGLLGAALNLAKLVTVFPRSGFLAPGGGSSIVAVIPIWVWSIATGVVLIRGTKNASAVAASPTRTNPMAAMG